MNTQRYVLVVLMSFLVAIAGVRLYLSYSQPSISTAGTTALGSTDETPAYVGGRDMDNCPSDPGDLFVTWKKPVTGVPINVTQIVLVVWCQRDGATFVPMSVSPTSPYSTVAPATSDEVTKRVSYPDLHGAVCRANILGLSSANKPVWYAVQNPSLDTVGTLDYTYNGTHKSNVGVAENGQGGGDFVWTMP